MKKILSLALLFVTFVTKSQTTEEEYLYVTKGYKIQKESGLDMKAGYKLQLIDNRFVTGKDGKGRDYTLYSLIRTKDNSFACFILFYKNLDDKTEKYMCIPGIKSTTAILDKSGIDNRFQEEAANGCLDFLFQTLRINSTNLKVKE